MLRNMNIQKLRNCMEILKKDTGDGLLASSIINLTQSQTLVATENYKSMFSKIACFVQKTSSQGYPDFGRYYYLDLAGNRGLFFIPVGDYQWGIAIDTSKVKLGMLITAVLPKIMNEFEEAVRN